MDEERSESSENEPLLTTQASHNNGVRNERDGSLGSPDGGRAWVVAFSIFVVNFIIIGLGRVSGIFYVDFMRVFNINRRVASTPFSAQQSTRNLFGPVVGILGRMFSVRELTMTGGLIAAVSAAGCAYAPNIIWISVMWGDLYGIATAFTSTINQYFVRNRSTASGVAFAGGSLGSMLLPFLVDYLMEEWGVTGTYFTMAVVLLMIIPVAIIMKTPPWLMHEETSSEVSVDESRRPREGSMNFQKLSGLAPTDEPPTISSENLESTSDRTSNFGQKALIEEISGDLKYPGKALLSPSVLTSLKAGSGTFSKFFEGRIREDTDDPDEKTPLNPKTNSNSKPKRLLGGIFQPIISIVKDMFIEPSNGNKKDLSPVPTKGSHLDDTIIDVEDNSNDITQDSNVERDSFNSSNVIIDANKSSEILKGSITTMSTTVKEIVVPRQHETEKVTDSRSQNIREEIFQSSQTTETNRLMSCVQPLLLQNIRSEESLESIKEIEFDETLTSETSISIQPEKNESSSLTYDTEISQMSFQKRTSNEEATPSEAVDLVPDGSFNKIKQEVSFQRFQGKENEQTEKSIEGTVLALHTHSENLVEDIDSKSNLTEMQHATIQSAEASGLQFTIHLKKQDIPEKIFQSSDSKKVIRSVVINPLKTSENISDKYQELEEMEEENNEKIVRKVKMSSQLSGNFEQKHLRQSFTSKDLSEDLVSIFPTDDSSELVLTRSFSSSVNVVDQSSEGLVTKDNDKSKLVESIFNQFQDPSQIMQENVFQTDSTIKKTLSQVTSLIETDSKTLMRAMTVQSSNINTESESMFSDECVDNSTSEMSVIEQLSRTEDRLLSSVPRAFLSTSTSSVNTITRSGGIQIEEKITEGTGLHGRSEIHFESAPQTHNLTSLQTETFHVETDWMQESSSPLPLVQQSTVLFKKPMHGQMSIEGESSEYFSQDDSSNTNKSETIRIIRRVSSSEENFQDSNQSINKKFQKSMSFAPASHTVISIVKQSIVSEDEPSEASESSFYAQALRAESEKDISVSKQKRKALLKRENYTTSGRNEEAPFWPGLQTREIITVESAVVGGTPNTGNEEVEYEYVDFKTLHENINYILHIIRITESLKQISHSQGTQSLLSEKSEIRSDLQFFLYSIEETITEKSSQQSKSLTNIHSSSVSRYTIRKRNGMFRAHGKSGDWGPDAMDSQNNEFEDENKSDSISFRNQYIYEVLLMIFGEDGTVIASHFPEQDQEHVLKVILELQKLVRYCQMLESKYSSTSITSKRTLNQKSKQMSDTKTYISSTQKSQIQQSVDSKSAAYGSITQSRDYSSLPSSSRNLRDENIATNNEKNYSFEHTGENHDENGASNLFFEHFKVALRLYSNPLFLLVCIGRVVHFFTFMAVLTIIVDYGMDRGLKEKDGKFLIGAMALGDFIGRLCCGWITDFGIISLEVFMVISMLLLGAFSISFYLVPVIYLYTVTAVYSILQGAVFVRHPVLICKYTNHHEQTIGLGFINLWAGILGFAGPNYIGYFRDVLGSYDQLFCVNGGMCIIVGLMWTFVPCYLRLSSGRPGHSD